MLPGTKLSTRPLSLSPILSLSPSLVLSLSLFSLPYSYGVSLKIEKKIDDESFCCVIKKKANVIFEHFFFRKRKSEKKNLFRWYLFYWKQLQKIEEKKILHTKFKYNWKWSWLFPCRGIYMEIYIKKKLNNFILAASWTFEGFGWSEDVYLLSSWVT